MPSDAAVPPGFPGGITLERKRFQNWSRGIVVDDLDAVETKVRTLGYATHSHADYEPGRRFYFDDENGIEFEVVSYA